MLIAADRLCARLGASSRLEPYSGAKKLQFVVLAPVQASRVLKKATVAGPRPRAICVLWLCVFTLKCRSDAYPHSLAVRLSGRLKDRAELPALELRIDRARSLVPLPPYVLCIASFDAIRHHVLLLSEEQALATCHPTDERVRIKLSPSN
uniref:Lipoprotein n=1 Tax=Macrostomum lignano TaxID=282301 RepID=A0A1I8FDP3_9PLAT